MQYLDILSFVVITVYVFTFSGLKATITFLLEISSLFDAFMQPKNEYDHYTLAKRYELYEFEFYVRGENHLLSSPVMTITTSLVGPGPIFVEADTVML